MKTIWKDIIHNYFLLLFVVIVAAVIGFWYVDFKPSFPYADTILAPYGHPLFWSWANFDGVHYLMLSESGYAFGLTQAFFPLYFILIRILNFIINNRIIAGLLISHLAFIASLGIFYRLIRFDFEKAIAKRSLIYLAFFPTSFYFLSVYTESLFLLLLLGTFYCLRLKKWFLAGILGILLTSTRLVGIFILPAFIYEIWLFNKSIKQSCTVASCLKYLYALIPSLGLLIYILYLNKTFHDPLIFINVQEDFGGGRQTDKFILLYQVFWRYLKMIFTVDQNQSIYFTIWLEFLSTISAIALLVWAFIKKIRLSYLIFALPAVALPTLTGTLSSMPRYVLVIFPIFIALGAIKKIWWQKLVLMVNTILLIICTVLFTRGYWVA